MERPSPPPALLALVVLSVLAVTGWYLIDEPGSGARGLAPPTAGPAVEPAPTDGELEQPGLTTETARETADLELEAPEASPEAAVATPRRTALLRGRVLGDALGEPIAGATVRISRRLHGEFRIPDIIERRAADSLVSVTTDAEGRFKATVPRAVPLVVVASATEHADTLREPVFGDEEVELRLEEAASLEVVLMHGEDGAPVEDALVVGRSDRRVEQCRGRTDRQGRVVFEGLRPGTLTLVLTPRDAAIPPSVTVELQAGVTSRVDRSLEAGVRVFGTVSDPDGRPIEGAEVGLGPSYRRSVLTDASGAYELPGLGGVQRRDLHGVRVRAEGFGAERERISFDELTEDTRVDFVLRPGRSATGRVVDPGGAPLEGVYVAGVGSKRAEGITRTDWESTLTDAAGRFELTTLHQLIDHQLFLRREGYGTRVYDFPADEEDQALVEYGDLVLHPGGSIEGSLGTTDGAPLPNHLVKLRGANADLGRFRPEDPALENTWVTSVRESRTDASGRFHFTDLPGGEFRVTAAVEGRPDAQDEAAVSLPEGGEVLGVGLTLEVGAPITGVVRTPDGEPAVGVFVQAAGDEDLPRIRCRSGDDGAFELLGVTEAMGEVELFTIVASYNWNHPEAPLGPGQGVMARAGESGLLLELRELTLLTGRVEDAAGAPLPGIQVLAYHSGRTRVPAAVLRKATTDEEGGFQMDLPEDSSVDLVALPPSGEDSAAPAVLEGIASDVRDLVLPLGE